MPERLIDLRSDTVTRPTPEMRAAMAIAEVGDDVYQEDPTVNHLERRAAEIFGKQAALFVPTGTMGNTIAIKLLTEPGQEVVSEARGHLLNYELSMTAWFSACLIRPVAAEDGILTWAMIEPHVRPPGPHWAPSGCIALENTHNMAGGTVYPQEVMDEIADRAHERGIGVHLDGARIFNAAAATGRSVSAICAKADTVMFCLSKALGAPAGSMLVGTRAAMDRARLYRKRLGGGMRQAGILAAAGLIALEEMPARLERDHENARQLAAGLQTIPGIAADPQKVRTNIVLFGVAGTGRTGAAIGAALKQRGVLVNPVGPSLMRAVTHYDVTREDCLAALEALREALAQGAGGPSGNSST
jgi:threonine aldolase